MDHHHDVYYVDKYHGILFKGITLLSDKWIVLLEYDINQLTIVIIG